MPKIVTHIPTTYSDLYNWDEMFDGQLREYTLDEVHCTTPVAFAQFVRKMAKQQNIQVTAPVRGNKIYVRALPANRRG